ncbi:MAG: ABC transporter permease, partial [Candidatus Rokubacteria bacterium]|nr:ABC transporter permease [Candidatus Rokubacteria bacterium]
MNEWGPFRHRGVLVGGALLALFIAAALLAPWLAPFDPRQVPTGLAAASLLPPAPPHALGTDALGRDLLSRVLYGGRVSLMVGVGVELVAALIGALIGLVAGY